VGSDSVALELAYLTTPMKVYTQNCEIQEETTSTALAVVALPDVGVTLPAPFSWLRASQPSQGLTEVARMIGQIQSPKKRISETTYGSPNGSNGHENASTMTRTPASVPAIVMASLLQALYL